MKAYENLNKELVISTIESFKEEFKNLPRNKWDEIEECEQANKFYARFDKALESVGIMVDSYDWICAYEDVMA